MLKAFWGIFFSEGTNKNAKTGKEFGIEGKNVSFLGVHLLSVRISAAFSCILLLLCIFSQTSKIRSGSGELRSKD